MSKNQMTEDQSETLQRLLPRDIQELQNETLSDLFNPFKQKLREIDSNPSLLKLETKNKINKLLSKIIHYCHRQEIVNQLSLAICKFKGQLKNMHIEQPPEISCWQNVTYKFLKQQFCKLPIELQNQVNQQCDKIYIKEGRIPHFQLFLRLQPQIFIKYCQLQNSISNGEAIQQTQKLFIAIIAVSNFGCLYFWNRLVNKFLEAGGDINWIKLGLKGAPTKFHYIALLSQIIAYTPQLINNSKIFENINQKISKLYLTEAIVTICYYQSLSCYVQAHGILPEQKVDQTLIDIKSLHVPSKLSFQNLYNRENIEYSRQIRTGQKILEDYSVSEDTQIDQQNDDFNYKKVNSIPAENLSQSQSFNENIRSSSFEQNLWKSNQSKTFEKIKKVFSKFAYFTIQRKQQQLQKIVENLQNSKSQSQKIHQKIKKRSRIQIIYATEWNFQHSSSVLTDFFSQQNKIANNFSNFFASLQNIHLGSLSNVTKKKCKEIQYYYQFLCYYIHLHINYKKLITEQVNQDQKFLIKLVTKFPYLISKAGLRFFEQHSHQNQSNINLNVVDLSIITLVSIMSKMQVLINLCIRSYSKFCLTRN